jgi:hypothetical protein
MNLRYLNSLKKTVTTPTSVASDGVAVSHFGGGHGVHQAASVIEGATSTASLAQEAYHGASKALPAVEKAVGGVAEASKAAGGAGKLLGMASKAAPYAWAGNMVLQGVDVAMDPAKNKADTAALADKNVLERAWEGFKSPVKTIAGTGQMLGELASLTYGNALDEYKNKTSSMQAPGKALANVGFLNKDQATAPAQQDRVAKDEELKRKASNYLASTY